MFSFRLEPEFEVSGSAGAEAAVGFSASVAPRAELVWSQATGGTATLSGQAQASVNTQLELGAAFEGEVALRYPVTVKVMGVPGPYVGPEVKLNAHVMINDQICAKVTAGLSEVAGAELKLWRFMITIAQVELPLWERVIYDRWGSSLGVDAGVDVCRSPPRACSPGAVVSRTELR